MKPFKQYFLDEKSPPSKEAEKWIKDNKENFKDQYGEDYEKILYATAWKLFGEQIDERMWFDRIVSLAARNIFASKDYEHALQTLVNMLERKRSEGKIHHDIDYYANAVAKSYRSVDGYELADMYKELFPKTKRG